MTANNESIYQSSTNDSLAGLIAYNPDKHVESWKNLPQDRIETLPDNDLAQIRYLVEKHSRSQFAQIRIRDLEPVAKKSTTSGKDRVIRIAVALLSASMFSAGTQILTARLGRLGLPTAIGIAGFAGYLVEDRGVKAITRFHRRADTWKVYRNLETYRREHPPLNELEDLGIQARFDILQQVESESFSKHFPIDGTLAFSLGLAEYVTALWIVLQLGLPVATWLEAIVASLPVVLLWITAAWQSDMTELPKRNSQLIYKYEPHIFESEKLSPEQVRDIYALDCRIQFVIQGDPSGQIKNLGMAQANFLLNYYRNRKQQLEQTGFQEIATCRAKHRETVAELPNLFTRPAGVSDQEYRWEKQQWIEQQTRKLEAELSKEIEMRGKKYAQLIQACDAEIAKAQKAFDESYQHWLRQRESSNISLLRRRNSSHEA